MKILVSGFNPFLGQEVNPSGRIAEQLPTLFDNLESIVLPVEYGTAFNLLEEKVLGVNPDLVLMLGQARGRKQVCLEKIGMNWIHSNFADEKGLNPIGPIMKDKALALMTSFPCEKLAESVPELNISFSAGTYVCNELYYRVLERFPELNSVFIHVPLLPEQMTADDVYSLGYNEQLRIVKKLVHSLRRN